MDRTISYRIFDYIDTPNEGIVGIDVTYSFTVGIDTDNRVGLAALEELCDCPDLLPDSDLPDRVMDFVADRLRTDHVTCPKCGEDRVMTCSSWTCRDKEE